MRFWAAAALLTALGASAVQAEEVIHRFDSVIQVNADGSLEVQETIAVTAERDQIRHGLRRDFPVRYRSRANLFTQVPFTVVEVRCDGHPEDYHLGGSGNDKSVYVGRRDSLVALGDHTYQIRYRTDRQLGFFPDHDELYWNVTGNGWSFPIEAVSAKVLLPVSPAKLDLEAYTGFRGAKGQDYAAAREADGWPVFRTRRPLGRGEGLTIVVGFPKGIVREPTWQDKAGYLLKDNRSLVTALGALAGLLAFYLTMWFLVGKDPHAGTIIPQFRPPAGLSAPAVRFIKIMGFDNRVFTAALVESAVKGDLVITEHPEVIDSRYTLAATSQGSRGLWDGEAKAIDALFGTEKQIELSKVESPRIQKAVKALKQALQLNYEKAYFVTNRKYFLAGLGLSIALVLIHGVTSAASLDRLPIFLFMCVWLSGWSVGVAGLLAAAVASWAAVIKGSANRVLGSGGALFITLFSIPFLAGEGFGLFMMSQGASLGTAFLLVSSVGINALFYFLLKAPTRLGRSVLDQIDGFKMYLETAEKDPLNARYPLDKSPKTFETLLPYAIALGVENAWAAKFADVLGAAGQGAVSGTGYQPTWYSGPAGAYGGPAALATGLAGAFGGAVSSAANPPGSSSGGGGGGSSGGGGGGGGGGGW